MPAGCGLPSRAPAPLNLAPPPRATVGWAPWRWPASAVLSWPFLRAAWRRMLRLPCRSARPPPLGRLQTRPVLSWRCRPPRLHERGRRARSLHPPRALRGTRPPLRPRALPQWRTPTGRAPPSCPRAWSARLPFWRHPAPSRPLMLRACWRLPPQRRFRRRLSPVSHGLRQRGRAPLAAPPGPSIFRRGRQSPRWRPWSPPSRRRPRHRARRRRFAP